MKKFKLSIFFIIYSFFLTTNLNSLENKILFKVNNEIITSLDILNEIKYLETINEKFKNTNKQQAFEIAKKSLIREKIKELELKKVVEKIEIKDQNLDNIILDYFKKIEISSIADFNKYFSSIGINPNIIKKKISIEILWNQLIFSKYSQSVKINRKNIIDDLANNNKKKQYLLSEILFNITEDENLEKKFNLIKNKINESNFSEAALLYSISDTANKGGMIGWINESTLSNKINNIIKNLNIGDISNPIVIPGGFIIIKIENLRKIENNFNKDEEIEKIIREKTNEQLNQFSNIFFNKIQKNIIINEL